MNSLLLLYLMLGLSGGSCSISGRVVDDRGRPVPYAAVNAISEANRVFGAAANERGEYCISAPLPSGQYRIRAGGGTRPPSAAPSCKDCCLAATDLLTTYHPKPVLAGPQRPVRNLDVRLRRGPVYCVRGEVRDPTGALLQRAVVALKFGDSGNSAGVISEAGRFLLTNLPPGVYTLVVADRPQLGRVLAERVVQVRDRNIDKVLITVP